MISNFNVPEPSLYFSEINLRNTEAYHYLFPALRQGLLQYFKKTKYKKVLLPEYVPEGIYDPFKRLGFEIQFYSLDKNTNLNQEELVAGISEFQPDVFVYIHHFGIYNHLNIEFIKKNIVGMNILFLEDFAHSLPSSKSVFMGDICTFSFTKMLGTSQGSLVWIRKLSFFIS
jgi:hypothetical protein